mmetsp:Transcript_18519/g.25966  ORF Transcript_18519/g.25966 Transcript_18519/m.25966 type:complete len:192 (-) Transcript_18519:1066-1641(-)
MASEVAVESPVEDRINLDSDLGAETEANGNSQSKENKANLTKTQESIQSKGDKSYYYWHPYVSKTVPIESPPLVAKQVVTPAVEETWTSITNYAWMDDEKLVKVYIDLAKVGKSEGVAELPKENVTCTFNSKGFELKIKDYKQVNWQLKLSNLKNDIDPENSVHKQTATKIILNLKKVDDSKTWYDLLEKK